MWIRHLMRTAFIFLVTMTMLANKSGANIRTLWLPLPGKEEMGEINTLETDGSRLYAGTDNGVYISDDDGHTWRSTDVTDAVGAIAISDDAVYAAGIDRSGVFRSDNHGETWNPKNNGIRQTTKETIKTGEILIPRLHQILVTRSGTVIAVGNYYGTYISRDRGETWNDPFNDWFWKPDYKIVGLPEVGLRVAGAIWSMTEFDGYLWVAYNRYTDALYRTPDNGGTWERLPHWGGRYRSLPDYGQVGDWAVVDNRLYAGTERGFARFNEAEFAWEDLSRGLPPRGGWNEWGNISDRGIRALALNRGRLFAGLRRRGVYMFDERSETWMPAGLDGLTVYDLISHQSDLYTATKEGIYRASIPIVQPYGKAAATWGAVKRQ